MVAQRPGDDDLERRGAGQRGQRAPDDALWLWQHEEPGGTRLDGADEEATDDADLVVERGGAGVRQEPTHVLP